MGMDDRLVRIRRVVYAASIEQLSKRLGQIIITSAAVAGLAHFADIELLAAARAGSAGAV